MDWTWRKTIIWVGIPLLIVLSPLFLMSSGMMDIYQERIDANPKTDFNKWLQLTSANICYKTLRPEMAAERYRKFMAHYPEDENVRFCLLRLASSLEDAEKTADALVVYQQFVDEYPGGDDTREAQGGLDRLRYMKPR